MINYNVNAGEDLQSILKNMTVLYLQHPEALQVKMEQVGRRIALIAKPHQEDIGRMNGGHGSMFHATVTILMQAAKKRNCWCHYSLDSGDVQHAPKGKRPFEPVDDWPKEELQKLLTWLCQEIFYYPVGIRFIHEQYKTRAHITLDKEEPKKMPDMELQDALSIVMHAIGAKNGRRIYVESMARR